MKGPLLDRVSSIASTRDIEDDTTLLANLHLILDSEAWLLIYCHEDCRFALSSKVAQITEHLRSHDIPPDTRRKITSLIRHLKPALRDPKTASPRPDESPRDANLRQAQGFACKFCNVRTTSKQIISRHVSDRHLAEMVRIGVKSPAMYRIVKLQSWIRNPPNGSYWILEDDEACLDEGTRPAGDQYVFEHLRDVVDRERQRQRLHQQRRPGMLVKDRVYSEIRPWLERTGWERTYSTVDRRLLRSLITMPRQALNRLGCRRPLHITTANRAGGYATGKGALASSLDDEEKIAALSLATERIIVRCERTAKTSGRNTLCWLRSVQPLTPSPKPFALVGKEESRKRYIKVLQRFVALIFRAYRLPPQQRQSRAGLSFSPEQEQTMAKIWGHLVWEQEGSLDPQFWKRVENDQEGEANRPPEGSPYHSQACPDLSEADPDGYEDEGESEDEDTDGSDYETDDSASGETRAISSNADREGYDDGGDHAVSIQAGRDLLELLFGLIMTFCMERAPSSQPSKATLVYFAGILGFSADCEAFLPPNIYTTHLAALVYIQRLLFLEYAIPATDYPGLGIQRRNHTDKLSRLQAVRRNHMALGTETPFEEIFSLLCYGRKAAADHTPPFLLLWSNDGETVSIDDTCTISMTDFRALPNLLLAEATRLCQALMYDMEPTIDIGRVRDSFTETKSGFSFVTHPDNGLSEQYLKLCSRACTSTVGSLAGRGGWRWTAVHEYLAMETKFREVIALLLLMTGGGEPRTPDLLHIRVENTGTAERGIYAYNRSIIYLTRSHKAKRSTNREFFVARFLPARVGELLYQSLVYIRPFVDMLAREENSSIRECSSYLFRSDTAAQSLPWTTGRLSSILHKWTSFCWAGQGVKIRTLRQLSVGITEKHVREVSRPFNRYDDHSETADRNVVLAWQTGHRPLVRARTYGLDGAYPAKLQPALLDRYEWASTRWHEFLHLRSWRDRQESDADGSNCTTKRKRGDIRFDVALPSEKRRSVLATMQAGVGDSSSLLPDQGRSSIGNWSSLSNERAAPTASRQSDNSFHLRKEQRRNIASTLCDETMHDPGSNTRQVELPPRAEVQAEAFLHYIDNLKAVACTVCELALSPSGIETHFRQRHALKGRTLQDIKEYCARLVKLVDPKQIQVPRDGSAPLRLGTKTLRVIDGFSCEDCRFLTRSAKGVRMHRLKDHREITTTSTLEGIRRGWTQVKLQTLCPTFRDGYWIVL